MINSPRVKFVFALFLPLRRELVFGVFDAVLELSA